MAEKEVCQLCEEAMPKSEINEHLKEKHKLEELGELPGEKLTELGIDQADADGGASTGSTTTSRCRLCGEEMSDDGELGEHIREAHSNKPSEVYKRYPKERADRLLDRTDREGQRADSASETTSTSRTNSTSETNSTSGTDSTSETTSTSRTNSTSETNSTSGTDSTSETTSDREGADSSSERQEQSIEFHEQGNEDIFGRWFAFGIGGAGNGILDSVLLRRETLKQRRDPLANVWGPGGLEGYHMLNSNDAELKGTFFIQDDMEWGEARLMQETIPSNQPSGIGADPVLGEEVAREHIINGAFMDRISIDPDDVNLAQATLLLHSIERGTGTSFTPVVAEFLRNDTEWAGKDKPMVTASILPPKAQESAVQVALGIGGLAPHVDSIMVFKNERLGNRDLSHLRADIDFSAGPSDQKFGHHDQNRTLVRFLEALTMSSNSGVGTRDDGLDSRDTYQPVKGYYPTDRRVDYTPATISAPVINSIGASTTNEEVVETLIDRTLESGRLVDFEPATAWGGAFLLLGPEEKMQTVSQLVSDNAVGPMIREQVDGERFLELDVKQLATDSVDELYMLGVFWNPEIEEFDETLEEAELLKDLGIEYSDALKQKWRDFKAVYNHLGVSSVRD